VYNPSQVIVQSTTVYRAIQSGYSELMGLYPPIQKRVMKSADTASMLSEKSLPMLRVRSKHHLLGGGAIPDLSYVPIPIFNFLDDNDQDYNNCKYADELASDNWKNHPEIFNEVAEEIMPIARHPLAKSQNYNASQEAAMKFSNAYSISDKLKTEIYEGTRDRYYFTPE
jgi:hypothetical protein